MKTTSGNSINLDTIRKVVKYFLKNVAVKHNVYSSRFRGIAVLGKSVLSPVSRDARSGRLKFQ